MLLARKLGRDWFTTEAAVLACLTDEALRRRRAFSEEMPRAATLREALMLGVVGC